jgi:N-acetylneuraminic acid mutarotase
MIPREGIQGHCNPLTEPSSECAPQGLCSHCDLAQIGDHCGSLRWRSNLGVESVLIKPMAFFGTIFSVYSRWLWGTAGVLALAACGGSSTSVAPGAPFIVEGTITGLTANGLVLANNGESLTANSGASAFAFSNGLEQGSAYAVTIQSSPAGLTCSVVNGVGTIDMGSVTNVAVSCSDGAFTLGGTITGLAETGLRLANGPDQLIIPADATSFTLSTSVAFASTYAISVAAAPPGLTCSVANGAGIMGSANVSNVVVTCSDQSFTLGGTVSGLLGAGLVLVNGNDNLVVPAKATSFTFPTAVAFTSSYSVTVATQPAGQSCTTTADTGAMPAANVTNVLVSCSSEPYTLGGSISGLIGGGLVLANGSDRVTVPTNASGFLLPTAVAFGNHYAVTVDTQPAGLTCTVSAASGTMPAANVVNIAVVCSSHSYTLGGIVSGLNGAGLVLANGTDSVTVAANATSFTLPAAVAFGSSYSVMIATQPVGLTCTVAGGAATMPAMPVASVTVTCSDLSYTLGGSISGLSASGLILSDGTDVLPVATNAAFFSMPSGVAYASHYIVSLMAQPTGLSCTVTQGTGIMPAANVASVQVTCAAAREWTWKSGSHLIAKAGSYGSQGVAAPGNVPGARYSSGTWVDGTGRLWLFGGSQSNSSPSDFNDLWVYDPGTGLWTWVNGPNTINSTGSYGSKGVAATSNLPSARHQPVTWADGSGHLWLFGGYTDSPGIYGLLNDLWSYDIATNQWTWVSGSNTPDASGIYGTPGVASLGNAPGARLAPVSWIDTAGHLILFGGNGFDAASGSSNDLNDLWSYDPATNMWTWLSGSNTASSPGVYGSLGVAAVANVPPARNAAVSWEDAAGHLWLFGGSGLNDLWSFDPGTQQWTWQSGSNTSGAGGVYGTQGVPAALNVPGSRSGAVSWTDTTGRFWLFSGYGQDTNGNGGFLSDLWSYDPSAGQWTWQSGAATGNTAGVYGSLGVAAAANAPGGRLDALSWIDGSNHLWMFGGYGSDSTGSQYDLNDLWEY